MAQDIRDLFKNEQLAKELMPKNHEDRFLEKLNTTFPEKQSNVFKWYYVAASVIVLLGLSFSAFTYFSTEIVAPVEVASSDDPETKTLGDVSPGLKKIEDYYLASINLELSKIKPTPETKELFDGYVSQLDELNKEYKRLSVELTESGPSELTVNALIDNLKFRLNLLYRLREQLKLLNNESDGDLESQSI